MQCIIAVDINLKSQFTTETYPENINIYIINLCIHKSHEFHAFFINSGDHQFF